MRYDFLRTLRKPWSRVAARLKGLRDDCGAATLEVAVVSSVLAIPLLLGTSEMSFLVYDSIEISNAAHAGALYGMQSLTFAANTSGMQTAAQTEAGDFGASMTVTPTTYYACSTAIAGTQYTGANAQSNATAACTGGSNHPLEFVQVNTSATITPPVHCPGFGSSFTLTGSSVMEVEQ